jgi:hypothetical protein
MKTEYESPIQNTQQPPSARFHFKLKSPTVKQQLQKHKVQA